MLEAKAASTEVPTAGSDDKPPSTRWQEVHAKYLQGAIRYPDLHAQWDSGEDLWTFRDAAEKEFFRLADSRAEELFKDAARDMVDLLGKSGNGAPPWHIWLDLMRNGKRGFRHARHRSWPHAKMILESEVPLDLPSVLLKNGGIAHVFKESADFCKDLAGHPLQADQSKVSSSLPEPQEQASPAVNVESTVNEDAGSIAAAAAIAKAPAIPGPSGDAAPNAAIKERRFDSARRQGRRDF